MAEITGGAYVRSTSGDLDQIYKNHIRQDLSLNLGESREKSGSNTFGLWLWGPCFFVSGVLSDEGGISSLRRLLWSLLVKLDLCS